MNREKNKLLQMTTSWIYIVILALFIPSVFLACCNNMGKKDSSEDEQQRKKYGFNLPAVPPALIRPEDRADYLVIHYWDNFDFMDTAYCRLPDITEQAFADYLNILPHAHRHTAYISVRELLEKAGRETSGTMLRYFFKTAKDYMYDPNSPLRNEEFYIPVAEYIVGSGSKYMNEADKQRAGFDLMMMRKNRIGQAAADFIYTLESGKKGTLHGIKSEYILLLFYNPDCHACEETIAYLKQAQPVNTLLLQGRLKILALYPDNDLQIWKKHLRDIPDTWLNAYDGNTFVKDKQLYDLKAIPTLYLLDKDKRVVLKDINILQVQKWLDEQQ